MSQLQVTGEAKIRDIQGPVVANSGVVTALDGAASQYVRGDGTLADFPTSTGGGSSVSYYLNSSVSQGTIGGVAYRELSKDPIIGTGTDIAIAANGYVANYITDVNDPDVTIVPGGNFNCEFYFSVNNNTGNPTFYAELYKYDGTTFTLLGTSAGVPESINQGTTIAPYYFAIPVATAALSVTDRLAIRIYVNVSGRTVTLHTENGHLCQVVTTLSKGMVSLNNLTDQSQYLATGTSGTNFGIVSTGDTHTFNLPVASATNTGKLSSTDWSTFNGKVPYTGAIANVDLGNFNFDANNISGGAIIAKLNGPASSPFVLKSGSSGYTIGDDAISLISSPNVANTLILASNIGVVTKTALIGLGSLTANRTFTLPDLSGTLALLEGTQIFSGSKTFSVTTIQDAGIVLKDGVYPTPSTGYVGFASNGAGVTIVRRSGVTSYNNNFQFPLSSNDYNFPNATGTIALTSNLSAYLPLAGGTLSGALSGTSATFSGQVNSATKYAWGSSTTGTTGQIATDGTNNFFDYLGTLFIRNASASANRLILTSTGNLTIGTTEGSGAGSLFAGAATLTGALSGTSASFSSTLSAMSSNIQFNLDGTFGTNYYTMGFGGVSNGFNRISGGTGTTDGLYITSATSRDIVFRTNGTGSNVLVLASTGAATFSSSVQAQSFVTPSTGGAGSTIWSLLHDQSFAGDFGIYNPSGPAIYFNASRNVLIGTTTDVGNKVYIVTPTASNGLRIVADPTYNALSIGGTGKLAADYPGVTNGRFELNDAGTLFLRQYGNGTVSIVAGQVISTSNINLKNDDGGIEDALSKVLKLNPRYFYWKEDSGIDSNERQLGFYAQEVQEALGEEVANDNGNGKWGVNDRGIIAMLTKAMQEQQVQIEELKALIAAK